MITVHKARTKILQEQNTQRPESMRLKDTNGLVLAGDVKSQIDLPPFCAAGIDGFAIIAHDTLNAAETKPVKLSIKDNVLSGKIPHQKITQGFCSTITAGAMMPDGADAVIVLGDVTHNQGSITINKPVKKSNYVRHQGEDIKKDEVILSKGKILTPASLGLMASAGIESCQIYPSPKIVIIPTGTELISPGKPIKKSQVYESNTYSIGAAIQELGFDILSCSPVQDDKKKIYDFFRMALKTATHVIVSGGVSVGDHDYTRAILADCNVKEVFWQVKQLPGNRFFYGKHDQTHVFGVPGNPASALVCYYEYIRPALLKSIGYPDHKLTLKQTNAKLSDPIKKRKGMTQFARGITCKEKGVLKVRSLEKQAPHILSTFAKANSLIVLPEDVDRLPKDTDVEVHFLE